MALISIIIPAYNAMRWLPETLDSVAAQEEVDYEVILVDDGSTDETASIIRCEYPWVRLVQTENKGVSHARNAGTAAASGELLQYLDADDLLLPAKLKRQENLLRQHPEVDVIYSNWQRLISDGQGNFALGDEIRCCIDEVHSDPEVAFFSSFWCPTGAYLYRRRLVEKIMPWKDWLPVIQDARFAWDAAAAGARWFHDPEVSVLYRQHCSGSVSTQNRRAFLNDCLHNADDICRIWLQRGELTVAQRSSLLICYESVARGLYEVDHPAFLQVSQRIFEIDPQWQPSSMKLRCISRLLGYENAEQIAAWWRFLKRTFSGASSD